MTGRSPWRVVPLLMGIVFLGHFNRLAMAVAGSERIIGRDGITPTQMGFVYSAFLIAYTLMMTPMGLLADRLGPWLMLVITLFGLSLGSLATGVVGLAGGAVGLVGTLLVVRSAMGLLSAPLHPSTARTVGNWFSAERRGLANGVTLGGAMLGAALTYYLFGALIDRFDWPGAFLVTGAITVVAGGVWVVAGGDTPAAKRASAATGGASASGWLELFRNRALMLVTLAYTAVDYFEYLFFYWMQYYFGTVLQFGAATSRLYSTIVTLAMTAGVVSGGWLIDRLARQVGPQRARRLVPLVGGILGAGFLIFGVIAQSPVGIVVLFSLGAFSVTAAEAPCWTTAVELGGARGSTASAVMNTAGNVGGIIAPIVTPWVGGLLGWEWAVGLGAAVSLLGGLLWLGVRLPETRPE